MSSLIHGLDDDKKLALVDSRDDRSIDERREREKVSFSSLHYRRQSPDTNQLPPAVSWPAADQIRARTTVTVDGWRLELVGLLSDFQLTSLCYNSPFTRSQSAACLINKGWTMMMMILRQWWSHLVLSQIHYRYTYTTNILLID